MTAPTDKRRGLRSGLLATTLAAVLAGSAWADADGHGPDAWRVTGVAAGDVLNARMGPGAGYAAIATFAADESGLQQVTCVPLVPQAAWMGMTGAERQALPPRWCLVRSADLARSGWVAQRYLSADAGAGHAPVAAAPAASTTQMPRPERIASNAPSAAPARCAAPQLTGGTAVTAPALLAAVQQDADTFTSAPGFAPVDLGADSRAVDWDRYYAVERFPGAGQSAFAPDGELGAITRAILLFDAVEGAIQHPRYCITYHVRHAADDCDIIASAYVEITRYSLGPARYADVIQHVDKAYWPPKAIFGTQPHVSWRLAVGHVQGLYTDIKQASRRVVGDGEAAAASCLGQPCLALQGATGPAGNWQRVPIPAPAEVYREPGYAWAPGPARMADLLFTQATGSYEDIEASEAASFERPDMILVIARDVQGQDGAMQGLLRWRGLMDAAVSELWQRVNAVPEGAPQRQQLSVSRRGGS